MLYEFLESNALVYERRYAVNPVKQWLVYLQHYFPQAGALFASVKRIIDPAEMAAALHAGSAFPDSAFPHPVNSHKDIS